MKRVGGRRRGGREPASAERARGQTSPARSPSPRPPSPKAGEAYCGHDLRSTSGVITVVTADLDAAARSPKDEGEHDKAGDEPCHHPQQKPLVRFHRFSYRKRRARRSRPRSGLVPAIAGRDRMAGDKSLMPIGKFAIGQPVHHAISQHVESVGSSRLCHATPITSRREISDCKSGRSGKGGIPRDSEVHMKLP